MDMELSEQHALEIKVGHAAPSKFLFNILILKLYRLFNGLYIHLKILTWKNLCFTDKIH